MLSLLALSWLWQAAPAQTPYCSFPLSPHPPYDLPLGQEYLRDFLFFGKLQFKLKRLNGRHCVKGPLEGATTTAAPFDVITQDALQENNSGGLGGKLLKFIKTKQSVLTVLKLIQTFIRECLLLQVSSL